VKAVARSFRFIAYSSCCMRIVGVSEVEWLSWSRDKEANTMRNSSRNVSPLSNRARELRAELARKIASFMGSEQNRATDIPGVTLHRRIAPTAPCSATYEPGVTVMAQGRKR
jgi:AraC-type transcriptional regulator N-terminus